MHQSNVPKLNFKNTDVRWCCKTIEDIASISSGGTPKRANKNYWEGSIPWITTSQINFNKIEDAEEFITELGINNSSAKIFPKHTILLAMYGQGKTRGKVGYLGIKAATNQACAAIITNGEISYKFLYYNLTSRYEELRRLSNSGGQKNLSAGLIKRMEVFYPEISLQHKIVSFLTAVDTKIEKLTRKKELLEEYKKGVVQKLFSGEIRFKDENGNNYPDWEKKRLKEISEFRRGSFPQPYGLKKWYDEINGEPFVQVYDVAKNMKLKPSTKNKISSLAQPMSVYTKKGTILITIQGSIGRIALTQYDAYVDRTLLIFKKFYIPLNKSFFIHVLFLLFEKEKRKAPGGTIKTITKEVLSNFQIQIPTLEEQEKIGKCISSMGSKIDLIEKKIKKNKEFKKGLLQQMFV